MAMQSYSQKPEALNLKCEYSINPLGVDEEQPFLSWEIHSTAKNISQSAYRIMIADDSLLLAKEKANVWDSKKVIQKESFVFLDTGKKLEASKKYFWKLMVWDNRNSASFFSKIASWQMGLINTNDWKGARWIAYQILPDKDIHVPHEHGNGNKTWGKRPDILPLFRKQFEIFQPVKRATAFVSGLGHFEMNINGRKVGDHFLDPGWTQYSKEAQYVSFDITNYLNNGPNTLGFFLGNGFYYIPGERYRKMTGAYGYPKLIARIKIEYNNGLVEDIVTNDTWKTFPSPIFFSSIYGGEDYDANLEQKGWDENNFNDANWKNVVVTTGPKLVAQKGAPIKVMQKFSPVKQIKIAKGDWVFDLGQNASGIPAIVVSGKKGDTIRIFPSELLTDSNTANQKFTGRPHYYTYVLKGEGKEVWHPKFSYYGFRYLQVKGIEPEGVDSNELPILHKIEGWHIRNSAQSSGTFSNSNELFNQIHQLILWAVNSNMVSVFTDCPHRERLGWQEQVHLMGNAIQHNYDIFSFAGKILRDIRTQQYRNGLIPSTVPEFTVMHFADDNFRDSPEWGSTGIIFPWYLYEWSGNKRFLLENYEMMKQYFGHLQSRDSSHLLMFGLSDWYDIGPERPGFSQLTPMGLTATAYYYYDAVILSKTARLLGKTSEEEEYKLIAEKIKTAFNNKFYDRNTRRYGNGSQASNAISLYMGLVEKENKNAVLNNLINDIESRGYSFTTGDIGHRYLLKVLEQAGRSDLIYRMNSRSDVPGYGYQLKQEATALTESWQALPTVSNNHFMVGHLMEWFYTGLAGIGQKEGTAGFENIIIKPQPVGDIQKLNVTYHSVKGEIKVNWKSSKSAFEIEVEIPVNSKAEIIFPKGYNKQTIQVGSGKYHFKVNK